MAEKLIIAQSAEEAVKAKTSENVFFNIYDKN